MEDEFVPGRQRDPWTILRLCIGWAVLVLWVVSIILNSIPSTIDIAPDLTPLMTVVVTALLGPEAIAAFRRRNGKSDDE